MTAFEQIRRDLDEYPSDLVNWEAACLKDVANLLDSLERARSEWQSLSQQLTETQARLASEESVRERAGRLAEDLDAARRQQAVAGEELERERAEAARARTELAAARAEVEELRDQRDGLRAELEAVRRERDLLAENEQGVEDLRAEVASLRQRLKQAERARGELEEERHRGASLSRELERVRGELGASAAVQEELEGARKRVAELERECEQLRAECEDKIVLVCDLRVRENRLEQERDEAVSYGRRKVRKVLDRIHEVLDDAGAPRGDELSYGDRIRWLAARIDERRAQG